MSYYSFKIRKREFELAVTSEDKYFVITQFDKVYRETIENPKKTKKADTVKSKTSAETVTVPKAEKIVSEKSQEKELPEKKTEEKEKTEKKSEQKTTTSEKEQEIAEKNAEKPVEKTVEKEETVKEVEKEQEIAEKNAEKPVEKTVEKEETVKKAEKEPETAEKNAEKPVENTIEKEETVKEAEKEPETAEKNAEKPIEEPEEEIKDFIEEDGPEFKEEPEPVEIDEVEEEEDEEEELLKTDTKDDFQKIIEEKLKEESQTTESSDEEASEEVEETAEETISYYEEPEIDDEEEDIAETIRKRFEEKNDKNTKVYDILQEKLASLPEEEKNRLNLNRMEQEKNEPPTGLRFNKLDDLIYLKKPQTKLDYLLLTSYFLKENEKKEKYSLKQINAKIIPEIKEPIDHSVVHESIAHGYFEVVPDAEGSSDITEYAITEEGVDYLLNEL